MRGTIGLVLLLLVAVPVGAQERVETGFDPRRDGLHFANAGDYRSPDGNCLGMSLLAIDNFRQRRARGAQARAASRNGFEDHATAAIAQELSSDRDIALTKENTRSENPLADVSDPSQILAALARMKATGEPEILAMRGDGGHAVVLHGFKDGKLQLYDPNFPNETVTWAFDAEKGLGRYSKPSEFYAGIETVTVSPQSQFTTSKELGWLRESCASDAAGCTTYFPSFQSVTKETRARDGKTRVRGRVSVPPGGHPTDASFPDRVWVFVDGKPVTMAFLDEDWNFDVKLPREAYAPGKTMRIVAVTKDGQFAGTHDLTPPPPSERDLPPPPTATKGLTGALEGTVVDR